MDKLREEVKRVLRDSGYFGSTYLHLYLKPWKSEAIKEGFTPDQVEEVINILVDEFFAERNGW